MGTESLRPSASERINSPSVTSSPMASGSFGAAKMLTPFLQVSSYVIAHNSVELTRLDQSNLTPCNRRTAVSAYPILHPPFSFFKQMNSLWRHGTLNALTKPRFAWMPHADRVSADRLAREIVEDLEAALEQFRKIAEDLEEKNAATPAPIVQRPAPSL